MSSPSRFYNFPIVLNDVSANGAGNTVNIKDFKNVQLLVKTSGGTHATIKIQGSLAESEPNFGASATAANPWDYVAVYDLNDPTTILVGSTGIVLTGTDIVKNLLVNVDALTWLNVVVSGYSAGSISVQAGDFTNQ